MIWVLIVLLLLAFASSGALGWQGVYYRLLRRDLKRWQQQGLITTQAAEHILERQKPRGLRQRLVLLVGFLGALLLLFSIISFVAANWDEMSRLSKLTWLIALLWFAYLIGWRLVANGLPHFAEAAWLLGVGLFGVNIALIAQMFHIDTHPPAGVLMWSLGAFLTALLIGSRAALVATFLGAIGWSLMESLAYSALVHWPFLLLWAAATLTGLFWRFKLSYHLSLFTLLVWAITSMVRFSMHASWQPHGLLAMFVMLFLLLFAISLVMQANEGELELDGFERWLERYSVVGLLASIFALQTAKLKYLVEMPIEALHWIDGPFGWLGLTLLLAFGALIVLYLVWREDLIEASDMLVLSLIAVLALTFALLGTSGLLSEKWHEFAATWVYGATFLALLIWFMSFGYRQHADIYVWMALAAFAGEVLYVYARIFGSLMETSLFFLIGGLLTLTLAYMLYRMRLGFEGPDDEPQQPVSIPKPRPAPPRVHHNPLQRLEP